MSEFSDYYVVYQRVGEHAMVLTGMRKMRELILRLISFKKTPIAGFTLKMALGMKM
ncbi:hypothetical protein AB9W25_000377 [Vibrio vulnificus]|uniref:hypothetical protein n=1 Tax=Vibrio vulnificus TaxID=672 RepID=UPI000AC6636C|nr:hypothetical protein [Vibrio vulnificus]